MKPSTLATLGICMLVPLAVGGCGDDDDESTDATGTEPAPAQAADDAASTVRVSETEYQLAPANPVVKVGTVTFEVANDGGVIHALEVEGPGGESETEEIEPGGSATLTVDLSQPGSYEWYCPIEDPAGRHRDLGMEGEVRVTGASGVPPPVDDSGGDDDDGSDDSGGSSGRGGSGY